MRSDGRVFAWGENRFGQLGINSNIDQNVPTEVVRVNNISYISAGEFHSLAARSDGTVLAWGRNYNGELGLGFSSSHQTTPLQSDITDVIAISAGERYSLALKSDGTVFAWGTGYDGRLGTGSTGYLNSIPTQVATISNIIEISAGRAHGLALQSDGTLWSWGRNYNGQLGIGVTGSQENTPVQVVNISNINLMQLGSIAAGGNHSMALLNDGTVMTWGDNGLGQLGDGTEVDRNIPEEVVCLKCTKYVGAGDNNNLAIRNDGTVWAWGDNSTGELGNGRFGLFSTIPVKVKGIEGITDITCGEFHNLALKSDKKIRAWGSNRFGELGDGTVGGGRYIPVLVDRIDCVKAIAAGESHSMALREDGKVFAWGNNMFGQLGDGTLINRTIPCEVVGLPKIAAIAAGGGFCLALDYDQKVWAWGDNEFGQICNGTTVDQIVPERVEDLEGIIAIACGDNHSLAIGRHGIVFAWGDNQYGQLGIGTSGDNSTVPVKVQKLVNIKAISGGGLHSLALTCDGNIFSWGDNENGQLGNGIFIDSSNTGCTL